MTALQQEPSAHAPWTRTMLGRASISWFLPCRGQWRLLAMLWAWPRRGIRMLTALPARRSGAGQPDECEEGVVDLAGVGPDDRVRAVRYHHIPGSAQQTRQPVSGGLGGQDAVLTALDDQDGDIKDRKS